MTLMARVSTFLASIRNFVSISLDRKYKKLIFGNSNISFSYNTTILKAAVAFIVESSRFD